MLEDIFFLVRNTAGIALVVQRATDNVKYNKEQCKALARTCGMIHERLTALKKEEQVVETFQSGIEEIYETLIEAKEQIEEYEDKNVILKLLKNNADLKKFTSINQRLEHGISHLGLALDVQSIINQDRILAAQAEDRKYLIENRSQLEEVAKQQLQNQEEILSVLTKVESERKENLNLAQAIQSEQMNALSIQFSQRMMQLENMILSIPGTPSSPVGTSLLLPNFEQIDFCELLFEDLIAKGQHSQVLKGVWQGRSVAIKRMNHFQMSLYRREIQNEMQNLSQIEHPNIVKFYGGIIRDNSACVVMEYMNLGNLHEFSQKEDKSSFTLFHQAKIALDISEGLEYLHAKGKVHNALRPHHVLLDVGESGLVAKLVDFEKSTTHSKTLSTVARQNADAIRWSAPERIKREKANEKQDIYSFGLILWWLLTGSTPFEQYKNEVDLANAIMKGGPLDCSEVVSVQLKSLIGQCCHSIANSRPSWSAIQTSLRDFISPENLYDLGSKARKAHSFNAARRYYEAADAAGHAKAPTELGLMVLNKEGGFLPSASTAFQFFRAGSNRGHSRATLNLAKGREKGLGDVSQDKAEAEKFYAQLISLPSVDPRMKKEAQSALDRIQRENQSNLIKTPELY